MTETTTRDTVLSTVHTLHDRRAGDVERTATCEALAEHYVSGRLSRDELENRLGWAVRAVTENELHRLIADLPVATVTPAPEPAPAALGGPTWPASVVVAVIALVLSAFVAGGMLLVLGAVNPLLFLGACLWGGAAVAVGASGSYLLARATRRP